MSKGQLQGQVIKAKNICNTHFHVILTCKSFHGNRFNVCDSR